MNHGQKQHVSASPSFTVSAGIEKPMENSPHEPQESFDIVKEIPDTPDRHHPQTAATNLPPESRIIPATKTPETEKTASSAKRIRFRGSTMFIGELPERHTASQSSSPPGSVISTPTKKRRAKGPTQPKKSTPAKKPKIQGAVSKEWGQVEENLSSSELVPTKEYKRNESTQPRIMTPEEESRDKEYSTSDEIMHPTTPTRTFSKLLSPEATTKEPTTSRDRTKQQRSPLHSTPPAQPLTPVSAEKSWSTTNSVPTTPPLPLNISLKTEPTASATTEDALDRFTPDSLIGGTEKINHSTRMLSLTSPTHKPKLKSKPARANNLPSSSQHIHLPSYSSSSQRQCDEIFSSPPSTSTTHIWVLESARPRLSWLRWEDQDQNQHQHQHPDPPPKSFWSQDVVGFFAAMRKYTGISNLQRVEIKIVTTAQQWTFHVAWWRGREFQGLQKFMRDQIEAASAAAAHTHRQGEGEDECVNIYLKPCEEEAEVHMHDDDDEDNDNDLDDSLYRAD